MDAVLIIVTYNSADHLPDLLRTIPDAVARHQVRTIVVDNASADATPEIAASWAGVTFIPTGANLGYSGAINVARELSGPTRALVILNPDLVLHPGSLDRLLNALQEPGVGIAVPTHREPDGAPSHNLREEADFLGALGDSCFGAHWPRRPRFLSEMLLRDEDYAEARDVTWASGAALAITAECDEAVGPWNSGRYFLYAEETDFARRARDLGFRIRYVPEAAVTHSGAGSGQSPRLRALLSVNRVRYFEAHHGSAATATYRWAVTLQHVLRIYDPSHREALSYVRARRRWAELPPFEPA